MLWYRNIKTGNMLSPANKMAQELMEISSLYEPVQPTPLAEPVQEPPQGPPEDPPKEPTKAPKNKKE